MCYRALDLILVQKISADCFSTVKTDGFVSVDQFHQAHARKLSREVLSFHLAYFTIGY